MKPALWKAPLPKRFSPSITAQCRLAPVSKSWYHVINISQTASKKGFCFKNISTNSSTLNRWFSTTDPSHADESKLPKAQFAKLADETLESFSMKSEEQLEDVLSQKGIDFDSTYSDGIWTLKLGHLGTYVLNKQTPNRQIWFSSPVSGPKRYNWDASKNQWVNVRDGQELAAFLGAELSKLTGVPCNLL